jgi:hypothetical protein
MCPATCASNPANDTPWHVIESAHVFLRRSRITRRLQFLSQANTRVGLRPVLLVVLTAGSFLQLGSYLLRRGVIDKNDAETISPLVADIADAFEPDGLHLETKDRRKRYPITESKVCALLRQVRHGAMNGSATGEQSDRV